MGLAISQATAFAGDPRTVRRGALASATATAGTSRGVTRRFPPVAEYLYPGDDVFPGDDTYPAGPPGVAHNYSPNPAAAIDLTGRSAIAGTLAQVAGLGGAYDRSTGARVTCTSTGTGYIEHRDAPYVATSNLDGEWWSGTVQYSATSTNGVEVFLVFADAAGTVLASPSVTQTPVASTVYRSRVTGIAPTGARQVSMRVRQTGVAISAQLIVTASRLSPGTFGSISYFDGADARWRWTGVAGKSTSVGVGVDNASLATSFPGHPVVIRRGKLATAQALAFRIQSIDLNQVLGAAVVAPDRSPVYSLLVDWLSNGNFDHVLSDLGPVVTAINVRREVTSGLPADIDFVVGVIVGSMSITLQGVWIPDGTVAADGTLTIDTDPVKTLSPYRPDADLHGYPIIGREVVLETGLLTERGPVSQPRFTGAITSYTPDSAARTVDIEVFDRGDAMRTPISQQAWGVDFILLAVGWASFYPARINSQWWIDRIYRACGYFASPPPILPIGDYALLLSATMHGAPIAEVGGVTDPPVEYYPGTIAPAPVKPWAVGDHPHKMLAPNPAYIPMRGSWLLDRGIGMENDWAFAASMMIRLPSSAAAGQAAGGGNLVGGKTMISIEPVFGSTAAYKIGLSNGVPIIEITFPDGTTGFHSPPGYTFPSEPTWELFGFYWSTTAGRVDLAIYRGSTDTISSVTAVYTAASGHDYHPTCPVRYAGWVPFTNFSLSYAWPGFIPDTTLFPYANWTPTAKIDVGYNELYGFPEVKARPALELLNEIVTAEYGTAGFDATGFPSFLSAASSFPDDAPELLTTDGPLENFVAGVDEAAIRNHIDIETVAYGLQAWEVVYEAVDPYQFVVPGLGTALFDLPMPEDMGASWTSEQGLATFSSATWTETSQDLIIFWTGQLSYVVSYAAAPTTAPPPGNITFSCRGFNARYMRLAITNMNAGAIRFATVDTVSGGNVTPGVPALRVPGRKVGPGPPALGNREVISSINRYGLRSWDLGGVSPWRQDLLAAAYIADAILILTSNARPLLREVTVPHNPLRNVYDWVVLADPDGMGTVTGWIAAMSTAYVDGSGATDTLLVRATDAPAGW